MKPELLANLSFRGKIQQTYEELQKIRRGTMVAPLALNGVRDINLVQYLGSKFPEGCTNKDGSFDMNHVYSELGINPDVMTVANLIDLDQDSKWLTPEIFRDSIRKGFRTSPFYNQLIAASVNVAQPQVNMPYIDLSDAEPKPLEEAENISKGTVSYGNKTVEIKKEGIGIDITYEALQYTTINLMTIFLQDIGVKLGHRLNGKLIDIAINGDQADLSQNAAVIGVENVVLGLQYSDILRLWIRGSLLGRYYTSMIANETMAGTIMALAEFKDKNQGTTEKTLAVNGTLPSQAKLFVSTKVPDNQIIFVDPSFAFVQLTASPLLVEGEKIVSKQIESAYATITTGFANVFREARVILDVSLPFAGNGFPDWMNSDSI